MHLLELSGNYILLFEDFPFRYLKGYHMLIYTCLNPERLC